MPRHRNVTRKRDAVVANAYKCIRVLLYYMILHDIILYYIILRYINIILHYINIILHYIILYDQIYDQIYDTERYR